MSFFLISFVDKFDYFLQRTNFCFYCYCILPFLFSISHISAFLLSVVNNFGEEIFSKVLEELKINTSQGKSFIDLTNKSNSKEFTDQMINSWREMMEFYPEFSKKLIQYSFITSGFNPTTTSFYQYIPPSFFFQNNFNGYVKKFNNKYSLFIANSV